MAYLEELMSGKSTIRTTGCSIIIPASSERCSVCTEYRNTLHSMVHRMVAQQSSVTEASPTNPMSSVNFRYLTTPQKIKRFRRLRGELNQTRSQVQRLSAKIENVIQEKSIPVSEEVHQDLISTMEDNSKQVIYNNWTE